MHVDAPPPHFECPETAVRQHSSRVRPLPVFNTLGWLSLVNAVLCWTLAVLPACAPANRRPTLSDNLVPLTCFALFVLSIACGWIGGRNAVGRAQTAAIRGLFLHVLIVMFGFALAAVLGAIS